MSNIEKIRDRVLSGAPIDRETALWLYEQPLGELCACADEIRQHFCGNGFDLCTIVNAKSGCCPENCKFCAQSAHNLSLIHIYDPQTSGGLLIAVDPADADALAAELQKTVPDARRIGTVSELTGEKRIILR